MAKRTFNKTERESVIATIVEQVFKPSVEQRKLKSAFWVTYRNGPSVNAKDVTMACVVSTTGSSKVEKWWKDPQFKEWFLNEDDFRQRAEYHAHLAQDVLEDLMVNAEKPSDRLAAARLAIDIAGKIKKAEPVIKILDGDIDKMGDKQLDAFIESEAKRLKGETSDEGTKG